MILIRLIKNKYCFRYAYGPYVDVSKSYYNSIPIEKKSTLIELRSKETKNLAYDYLYFDTRATPPTFLLVS